MIFVVVSEGLRHVLVKADCCTGSWDFSAELRFEDPIVLVKSGKFCSLAHCSNGSLRGEGLAAASLQQRSMGRLCKKKEAKMSDLAVRRASEPKLPTKDAWNSWCGTRRLCSNSRVAFLSMPPHISNMASKDLLKKPLSRKLGLWRSSSVVVASLSKVQIRVCNATIGA